MKKAKTMREKYWNELDWEEKVERMREVVKRLERALEKLSNSYLQLERHDHLDGQLVIRLSDLYHEQAYYGGRYRPNKDEEYF
jgi:hypothetical protein